MSVYRSFIVAVALAFAAGLHFCAVNAYAQNAPSSELFQFRNGFWINLHHYLYAAATESHGKAADLVQVARDAITRAPCAKLTRAQQLDWQQAVDYYAAQYIDRDLLFDDELVRINNLLGDADNAPNVPDALPKALIEVLQRAAPVYQAACWPEHRKLNDAWIHGLQPLLAQHGRNMAARLGSIYQTPWPTTPITVDVVTYANWAGAYTTNHPSRITLTSVDPIYQDDTGLEMIFHESSHTLDDRLDQAIRSAAVAQKVRAPRDLDHVVIFFTAGFLAQQELRSSDPQYQPVAYKLGLYEKVPSWRRMEPALRQYWQPYLEGKARFEAAIEDLVKAISTPQKSTGAQP